MKAFYDFLRFCINDQSAIPESVYTMDWNGLFSFLQAQALTGIGFYGCEKLGNKDVLPPRELLLNWFVISEQIKNRNKHLNTCAANIVKRMEQDGFSCCVLKGQGNALMYPDLYVRMPGDIDLLVIDADRKQLSNYILWKDSIEGRHFHHLEFQRDGIQIEVHFIPCSRNNPLYHRRLQAWFRQHLSKKSIKRVPLPNGDDEIPVPTREFNMVYQLSHIMHHFFDEGIGLRQMMDYYFLIMQRERGEDIEHRERGEDGEHRGPKVTNEKMTARDSVDIEKTLEYLGLRKFAGAVMYVMQKVFGMEEKYLIVPVDEWRGRTLLEEILRGGNFGQHSGLTQHGMAAKYFLKIRRNMRFVRQYPAEALCEPLFRTWHFFWRMRHR